MNQDDKKTQLLKQVVAWQQEDDEKRAVLAIAVEQTDEEGNCHSLQGISGKEGMLIEMLSHAMRKNKKLIEIVMKALSEVVENVQVIKLNAGGKKDERRNS